MRQLSAGCQSSDNDRYGSEKDDVGLRAPLGDLLQKQISFSPPLSSFLLLGMKEKNSNGGPFSHFVIFLHSHCLRRFLCFPNFFLWEEIVCSSQMYKIWRIRSFILRMRLFPKFKNSCMFRIYAGLSCKSCMFLPFYVEQFFTARTATSVDFFIHNLSHLVFFFPFEVNKNGSRLFILCCLTRKGIYAPRLKQAHMKSTVSFGNIQLNSVRGENLCNGALRTAAVQLLTLLVRLNFSKV